MEKGGSDRADDEPIEVVVVARVCVCGRMRGTDVGGRGGGEDGGVSVTLGQCAAAGGVTTLQEREEQVSLFFFKE